MFDEEKLAGMSKEALMGLQESLEALEQEDPAVKAAADRLDTAIAEITRREREDRESAAMEAELKSRACEHCGAAKFTPHHETCPEYGLGPVREAGGYQYMNEDFERLHTTSVPLTDEDALEYFKTVNSWFATSRVRYIWRRAMWANEYVMMPYQFNRETGEVEIIGTES